MSRMQTLKEVKVPTFEIKKNLKIKRNAVKITMNWYVNMFCFFLTFVIFAACSSWHDAGVKQQ